MPARASPNAAGNAYLLPCHRPETPSTTLIRPDPFSLVAVVCGTCTSSWSTNRNGMPASLVEEGIRQRCPLAGKPLVALVKIVHGCARIVEAGSV
jgi:hypothetical protein